MRRALPSKTKGFHKQHVSSRIIKRLRRQSANQDYVTDRSFHCHRFQKQTHIDTDAGGAKTQKTGAGGSDDENEKRKDSGS